MSTRLFVIIRVISPSPKIVKLLTFKAEDRVVQDHADMNAFAVDYIAVHDRPPLEAPQQRLRLLAGDSETNRALELFPLRHQPEHSSEAACLITAGGMAR